MIKHILALKELMGTVYAGETELGTEEVDGLTRDYVENNLDEIETNFRDNLSAHMSEEELDYLDLIIAAITYDQDEKQ